MDFSGASILSAKNLSRADADKILEVAESFLPVAEKKEKSNLLEGKVLAALFIEPSTRTRLSTETAMNRLGGRVINLIGEENASFKKGETFGDAAKVIECFADVMAVRHKKPGSVAEMAEAVSIPVINCGDGAGEHPTQALLDLFTIKRELGKVEGITVCMVGDLLYGRTVHSLAPLLAEYGVNFIFVSPERLKMPDDIKEILDEKGANYEETEELEESLKKSDVCYMTRVQIERFDDLKEYEKYKNYYVLSRELIESTNPKITILHPLPRVGEISEDVDDLPGAAYFREVRNGVAVRMAVLALILGKA